MHLYVINFDLKLIRVEMVSKELIPITLIAVYAGDQRNSKLYFFNNFQRGQLSVSSFLSTKCR